MGWQTISAFMTATFVLLVTPGQTMAIVVGSTLQGGRTAGFRTVLGIGLGEAMLIAATVVSIVASSAWISSVFPWISLIGATYLLWLSLSTLRSSKGRPEGEDQPTMGRPFWNGLFIALSNPTVLLFYAAFFVQFIDRARPVVPQMAMLAAVYFLASVAFDTGCVLLAGRAQWNGAPSAWLRRTARWACAGIYFATSILAFDNFLS